MYGSTNLAIPISLFELNYIDEYAHTTRVLNDQFECVIQKD